MEEVKKNVITNQPRYKRERVGVALVVRSRVGAVTVGASRERQSVRYAA